MNLLVLVAQTLFPYAVRTDPAPGLLRSKAESRSLHCEWLSLSEAERRQPGRLTPVRARGDYAEREVMLCEQQLLAAGTRAPGEDAILASLDATVTALANRTDSLGLDDRVWMVEANHPSAQVASKIAFATKNALMGGGLRVTDRSPTLSAGDVDVITRLGPEESYAAACKRYADNGSLRPGDALLAVMVRDRRETALHSGVCTEGNWAWLR